MNQTPNMKAISKKDNAQRLAIAILGTGSALGASQTFALTSADITTATSDNDASSLIDTAAIWILGIAVGIFAVKKVIAFFGRG
ncbi:hypothetical protein AAC899_09840 [Acinetobacter soli]|uniref:hypothetical protein n=1 Tax=Acinetobacter soli TaxID=487316 RepID=UPI00124C5D21|nr:hypothetical protein [Acinetobacter soli]